VGAQGPQGVKGDSSGAQGPQGALGPQGSIGAQGQQGVQGIQGAKGDTGQQGAVGPQGPQGTVNIFSCQRVTKSQSTTTGVTVVGVSCPAGYFLLNYGTATLNQNGGTVAFAAVRKADLYYFSSTSIPYAVIVGTVTDYLADSSYYTYTHFVDATCCPF
jgi:hypothetical protein